MKPPKIPPNFNGQIYNGSLVDDAHLNQTNYIRSQHLANNNSDIVYNSNIEDVIKKTKHYDSESTDSQYDIESITIGNKLKNK